MNANPNLATQYLGLSLRSPLVVSASPMAEDIRRIIEMENSGAGAVILPSLFEDPGHPPTVDPAAYARRITEAKEYVALPLIATLSAASLDSWIAGAVRMEQAGADALELNIYNLTLSPEIPSSQLEQSYLEIAAAVVQAVKIPVAVKLSPYFTNLARLSLQLQQVGVKGLVMFNRFYQSDVDLGGRELTASSHLSSPSENLLPRHWIALLYRMLNLDLAANTGFHTGADALKAVLCGASVVEVCSVLLQRGISWLVVMENELREAMQQSGLASLDEARGRLSRAIEPSIGEIERSEYRKTLKSFSQLEVPTWLDEVPLHLAP